MIYLCAEAGANAAKFQNFKADTIASDFGFKQLKNKLSHQSKMEEKAFQVYEDASIPLR